MTENRQDLSATFNVVATFSDRHNAWAAAEELRQAGIHGDRISVAGDAATGTLPEEDRRSRDARIGRRALVSTPVGAVGGAVVGAVIGAAVGLIAGVGGTLVLVFAVVGAVLLGVLGFLLGGMSSLESSQPSESSVVGGDRDRSVVGVHLDRHTQLDRAIRILHEHGASAVEVFDREGKRTDAA